VVPFLGAGANLAERPDKTPWELGKYLPSGAELAAVLAQKSRYPESDRDLLRVSQYVDAMLGERALYQYLRALFNADYPPTLLHRLLARIPAVARAQGQRYQLIITTNYDDALERALVEQHEEFDLVWYEAKRGVSCGKFLHRPPGGEVVSIDKPNEYDGLSLDRRTVVLKLHGAVNREDARQDSYVITEDNYIDYLSRNDISAQIPMSLLDAMEESSFLFLGYSMRDWNLRVILNRLWGSAALDVQSWAIQREHLDPKQNEIEKKLWADRGDVDLLQLPLSDYVQRLDGELESQVKEAVGG
ncbi:MAG: hypothetical protein QOJ12_442, partial [Thermoleophilales bacterium]|nr:hypothetical protein [Thermoleophilales bacterium]